MDKNPATFARKKRVKTSKINVDNMASTKKCPQKIKQVKKI